MQEKQKFRSPLPKDMNLIANSGESNTGAARDKAWWAAGTRRSFALC